MKNKQTYEIVLTGLGMALVFVATMFIKVPNALDGYFNLGDGFILLFASFLNLKRAARSAGRLLIGGLGSALADVAGGYGHYFFFTLVIKGLEGIVVSLLMKNYSKPKQISSYVLGSVIMVFGYFIAKYMLKGSWIVAASEIPANVVQGVAGIVIALVAYPMVKKIVQDKLN